MGDNIYFLTHSLHPLSVFLKVNIAKDSAVNSLLFEGAEHAFKFSFIVIPGSSPLNQWDSHSLRLHLQYFGR